MSWQLGINPGDIVQTDTPLMGPGKHIRTTVSGDCKQTGDLDREGPNYALLLFHSNPHGDYHSNASTSLLVCNLSFQNPTTNVRQQWAAMLQLQTMLCLWRQIMTQIMGVISSSNCLARVKCLQAGRKCYISTTILCYPVTWEDRQGYKNVSFSTVKSG